MNGIEFSPVTHYQHVGEFNDFLKVYKLLGPQVVVEIGAFNGATLWAWTHNNTNLKKLVAVDLPIPPSDGRFDEMIRSRSMWNTWMKDVQFIDIQGDSHETETFVKVANSVSHKEVDMLFIDGDHSYEGVKQDWEMYSPLVKKGGIVVFHDSVGYDSVKRLCDELRAQGFSNKEFYHQGGWGLFVVTI